MDYYFSATPEERIFLCGYTRVRRYGTTSRSTNIKPVRLIEHRLEEGDTLQRLALRYNSSVTDIKRVNRLWSNECLFLKSSLMVPTEASCTPDESPSQAKEVLQSTNSRNKSNKRISQQLKRESEGSMQDILSRIDSVIKSSSQSVKKLEEEYTCPTEDLSNSQQSSKRHNSLKKYEYHYQ